MESLEMLSLDLKCEPIPSPYPESERDRAEVWARIDLAVVDRQGTTVRSVLSWQWNANELLTWILANKQALLGDHLPSAIERGAGSIAERLHRFYDTDDADVPSDQALDEVFAYRAAHGIRFGMRGTDVPDVYIGLGADEFEISAWTDAESWRFAVDVAEFVQSAGRMAQTLRRADDV